jgi:hypothetical protein
MARFRNHVKLSFMRPTTARFAAGVPMKKGICRSCRYLQNRRLRQYLWQSRLIPNALLIPRGSSKVQGM